MSDPWRPRNINRRKHGNKNIGYVPLGNANMNNNIIKFYTRVTLKNGRWIPDPSIKAGTYYAKPRNGRNFITVANLYGGTIPIKTVHRWSNVNKERTRHHPAVPYEPWVGYPGNIFLGNGNA